MAKKASADAPVAAAPVEAVAQEQTQAAARVVEEDGVYSVVIEGGAASTVTDLINFELNNETQDEKGKVTSPKGHSNFLDSLGLL